MNTYALVSILLTFAIFLINVTYKAGNVSARVNELEKWRINIRQDMHEISDRLGNVDNTLKHLTTLIEERTERRERTRK